MYFESQKSIGRLMKLFVIFVTLTLMATLVAAEEPVDSDEVELNMFGDEVVPNGVDENVLETNGTTGLENQDSTLIPKARRSVCMGSFCKVMCVLRGYRRGRCRGGFRIHCVCSRRFLG